MTTETPAPRTPITCVIPGFTMGCGYLGNGLTVWNSAVERNGDYQHIAHISEDGKTVSWRKDTGRLPKPVVEYVNKWAIRMADYYREKQEKEALAVVNYKNFLRSEGYTEEQIARAVR